MIRCPDCGAALRFDPKEQMLICDQHGGKYDPESFSEYKYTDKAEEEAHPYLDVTMYRCPSCGAELVSTEDTAATFCSYCGSNVLLESRMGKMEYPTRIIPFRLNKEDAEARYKKKLKESLFAPSELRSEAQLEKFRGIYMPYWSYEFENDQRIHTTGVTRTRRGNYVYRKTYDLSADIDASYDGSYFDASVNFADDLSRSVKPFETKDEKVFNAAYMSGFYADAGDVNKSLYYPDAFDLAVSYMTDEAYHDPTFSRYGAEKDKIRKSISADNTASRMSLFPVWFMSLRSRDGKRISYAAVNGQTGKVAADIPIDIGKYILFSLILAVPIFLLMNTFLTLTPGNVVFISILLNLLGLFILYTNIKRARETDERLKDRAYQEEEKYKQAKAKREAKARGKQISGDGKEYRVKTDKKPMSNSAKLILAAILIPIGITTLVSISAFLYEFIKELFGSTALYIILGALVIIALVLGFIALKSKSNTAKNMSMIKPVVGIILCALVYLMKPAADYWYYGAAIISILLMLLSVIDIINRYNVSATHRMPQLMSFLAIAGILGMTVLSPVSLKADSSYDILLQDTADLLSDEEEQLLTSDMTPLTAYGHIAFVSIDTNSGSTASYARALYHETFGTESGTLFLIDMDNREIYIFSDGKNYDYITTAKAYSITDNVYTYATREHYYLCASKAFSQILTVLEGGKIAEPMKYISNALLSLLISLMTSFLIVTSLSKKREADRKDLARSSQAAFSMSEVTPVLIRETRTYDPIDTGSSGGGFSGGGGGGGGGGSSGGGGGHGF